MHQRNELGLRSRQVRAGGSHPDYRVLGNNSLTSQIDSLDKKIDGTVRAHTTRRDDGKTLAIEHTIIEDMGPREGRGVTQHP